VWLLTKKDEGTVLQGQPEDLFLFRLDEKSGAGYLWDIHELEQKGFAIVRDQRDLGEGEELSVGDSVHREVTAQSQKAAEGEIILEQRRPWQRLGLPCDHLHFHYDLQGKEQGLPRSVRRALEAA
jgi:predicted secreted protein